MLEQNSSASRVLGVNTHAHHCTQRKVQSQVVFSVEIFFAFSEGGGGTPKKRPSCTEKVGHSDLVFRLQRTSVY